jgi:hypothetical protein
VALGRHEHQGDTGGQPRGHHADPAAFGLAFKEAIELLPGGYRDAFGLRNGPGGTPGSSPANREHQQNDLSAPAFHASSQPGLACRTAARRASHPQGAAITERAAARREAKRRVDIAAVKENVQDGGL